MPVQGVEPWVYTPVKSILNSSTAAMIEPGFSMTCPTVDFELICNPKMASTSGFVKTPSFTTSAAPPPLQVVDPLQQVGK